VPARDEGGPSTSSWWVEYWSQSPAQWASGTPSPGLRTSTPPASSASKVATSFRAHRRGAGIMRLPQLWPWQATEPARWNTTREAPATKAARPYPAGTADAPDLPLWPMRARPCATWCSTPRWKRLDRIADGIGMRDGRVPARACVDVPCDHRSFSPDVGSSFLFFWTY
jgi:hypothetical protein